MFALRLSRGIAALSLLVLTACASVPEYEPITPHERVQAGAPAVIEETVVTEPVAEETVVAEEIQPEQQQAVISLSEQERLRAEHARNIAAIEPAKAALAKARTYANLTTDQHRRLRVAIETLKAGYAERALNSLTALNTELQVAEIIYTVVSGDSLWGISAKDEIYGNPYWWPLIYKNNIGKINDPDLIYADQQFNIDTHPLINDVKSAVQQAYDRGAWSLTDNK